IDLMGPTGFNKSLLDPAVPGVKGVGFMGGDILLGGKGNDTLEGKMGDDLIDGDRWLNVQLRAVYNNGTVRLVDSPVDLVDDVFSDPQRLNPGNISIVRSIVQGARGLDTAVFANPLSEYDIRLNANGTLTVTDNGPAAGNPNLGTGTDTLRNIEFLQFSDVTIPAPGAIFRTVPNVVNQSQGAATANITAAGLVVGTVTTAASATIAEGRVIS